MSCVRPAPACPSPRRLPGGGFGDPAFHASTLWSPPFRVALPTAAALFALALSAQSPATSGSSEIRWLKHPGVPDRMQVEVSGLPLPDAQALLATNWPTARWQELLTVSTDSGALFDDLSLPAISGSYEVSGQTLRFTPAFPLAPGVRYRARFRPSSLPVSPGKDSPPLVAAHVSPTPAQRPPTLVAAVHPSAAVLPANLLKFYLHFSNPMSRGHVYDHIHLLDDTGKAVELPFLELDEELWNPDLTRFTLLLDPGRIKRGLRPLDEVGGALEPGRSYTLVIDSTWRDAQGNPLQAGHRKTFRVTPSDRVTPEPRRWKVSPPQADTTGSVSVEFDEPLDHALAMRLLRVLDPRGNRVSGAVELSDNDARWRFIPETPWAAGTHRILVPDTIEDLAGNNVGKPFDVDLEASERRPVPSGMSAIPFEVR